jgi:hypothetical protein
MMNQPSRKNEIIYHHIYRVSSFVRKQAIIYHIKIKLYLIVVIYIM